MNRQLKRAKPATNPKLLALALMLAGLTAVAQATEQTK